MLRWPMAEPGWMLDYSLDVSAGRAHGRSLVSDPLPSPSVPGPPVTWTFAPTLDFSNPGNLGQGPRGDLRDYHRGWVGVLVRGGLSRSRQPPALGQRRPAFCCTVLGANARRRIIPALVIATAIYQREIATLHDVPKRNSGFL